VVRFGDEAELALLGLPRRKHGRHVDLQTFQQLRARRLAGGILAIDPILPAIEHEHRDAPLQRIDDPVFGSAGLGVVGPLINQVALPV
jgi:hypothetical protein